MRGQPVYDAERGLVFDGIDDAQVSRNSDAESNIEADWRCVDSQLVAGLSALSAIVVRNRYPRPGTVAMKRGWRQSF